MSNLHTHASVKLNCVNKLWRIKTGWNTLGCSAYCNNKWSNEILFLNKFMEVNLWTLLTLEFHHRISWIIFGSKILHSLPKHKKLSWSVLVKHLCTDILTTYMAGLMLLMLHFTIYVGSSNWSSNSSLNTMYFNEPSLPPTVWHWITMMYLICDLHYYTIYHIYPVDINNTRLI